MPQKLFIKEWSSAIKEETAESAIETLARRFKSGITVIARKAYDNNFIDRNLYYKIAQRAVQMYKESRKKKKEQGKTGGDFYRTAASRTDRRFFKMLLGSVQEGATLYSDAFRLTNTNRSTFANLADNIGGGVR